MTAIDLTGRTALVTGGNVGIGKSIALALAGAGADVALTYRTHDDTETINAITALLVYLVLARGEPRPLAPMAGGQ
jgi:NAD(P)-dependent dehydrogenase (short-subunit alcohol dehydrogenase family)